VFDARSTFRTAPAVVIGAPPSEKASKPPPSVPRPGPPSSRGGAAPPSSRGGAAPPPKRPPPRAPSTPDGGLPEALLCLLNDAVACTGADVALLQQVEEGGAGAVVLCSHGAALVDAPGKRTPASDAALSAARAGETVIAESSPGPAGAALRARLSRAPFVATGAFLIPIAPQGAFLAALEVGRSRPFRASEIAAVEALVDKLVKTAEVAGWGGEWLPDDELEIEADG
jgi:hypothetical protein